MFRVVRRFKWRLAACALGFAMGLVLASACAMLTGLFAPRAARTEPARVTLTPVCASDEGGEGNEGNEAGEVFASPEEVLAALGSVDVGVRREVFRRLLLRPGMTTAYYDYERDMDFPERAESARVERVNLDDSPEDEAVITFVRVDSPVAVVLKRYACGWKPVGAVSAWLRFEDYPYGDWLALPEAIRPGRHVLLVRDSMGDATRYTRRARVLRLAGDRLEQVAEIEEEAISPIEGYAGKDWAEVKRRSEASYTFEPQTSASPARLRVERSNELVRYSGVEPSSFYWREGDGVRHLARRHWRTRACEVIKTEPGGEELFVWSELESRFVSAGS
jgi:hypothetical protein